MDEKLLSDTKVLAGVGFAAGAPLNPGNLS
jgi:hypothetical protein